METENRTEIILLGFSKELKINITLFFLFLLTYLITCIGNGLIIWLFATVPQLHTPMYFFISNLSFMDLCYSSTAVPKLLVDIFSTKRTIPVSACLSQVFISMFMGGTEGLLLALMAYDRYVAICHPLYYQILMSWKICFKMTAAVWIGSFMLSVVPSLILPFNICSSRKINHFMCEVIEIIKIVCEDIHVKKLLLYSISSVCLLLPFGFIIVTYICIIMSVMKIHSVGRAKAFSTCTSHILVVLLCYGPAIVMYFKPSSSSSLNQQKFATIFYVIVTPMLNPLIYSLKNRDVKEAFKKLQGKVTASCQM
ncbi:olfactory receptor-like protein OLF3 [Rhinophrynus dorsalis]